MCNNLNDILYSYLVNYIEMFVQLKMIIALEYIITVYTASLT